MYYFIMNKNFILIIIILIIIYLFYVDDSVELFTELKKSTIKFYLSGNYGEYINFPLNLIKNLII